MNKISIIIIIWISLLNILEANSLKEYNERMPMPGVGNQGLGAGDWPVYHGSYMGWSFSPLKEINVKNLGPAWMHQPGKIKMGLQGTPIAVDGIIYYIASYNVVHAVDGYTGEQLWKYTHDFTQLKTRSVDQGFDENSLLFSPYSRGLAVGNNHVFIGTLDGQAVALDRKTGEVSWQTKVVETETCNCNFTSSPVIAGDMIVYGPAGGELFTAGAIYG